MDYYNNRSPQKNKVDDDIEILNETEEDLDQFKQTVIDTEVSKIPVLSRNNALFQTFQGTGEIYLIPKLVIFIFKVTPTCSQIQHSNKK